MSASWWTQIRADKAVRAPRRMEVRSAFASRAPAEAARPEPAPAKHFVHAHKLVALGSQIFEQLAEA